MGLFSVFFDLGNVFKLINVASLSVLFHLCVCVCNNIFCLYKPHFFIHSSVDKHVGCLYVLAIMNDASEHFQTNICVHVCLSFSSMYTEGVCQLEVLW